MPSRVTPATSLDSLRKTAKRWLKQLRANDPDARARFERAYPAGPERPVLRDVQHALAFHVLRPLLPLGPIHSRFNEQKQRAEDSAATEQHQ